MAWWANRGIANTAIGAFVIWFIRRAKGPDDEQKKLIEKDRKQPPDVGERKG